MPIFDRFIRYHWAEHALELAVQDQSSHSIRDWLVAQGLKGESARRTANLLTWLWFPKDETACALREEALRLFPFLTLEERLALHWGMAVLVFPTFRQTVQTCGRLLRLQGEFAKADVVARLLEKYSNQTTIKRSVERILQSLVDWRVVHPSAKVYQPCEPIVLNSPELGTWLLRSLLWSVPDQYHRVSDILNAGELFPFRLIGGELILHQSPHFSWHRTSDGEAVVGIS